MCPLEALCHLGLGKLCRRTGDGALGEEHLTAAATMYREMDVGFRLAQAEAALKEPGPKIGDDAAAVRRVRAESETA